MMTKRREKEEISLLSKYKKIPKDNERFLCSMRSKFDTTGNQHGGFMSNFWAGRKTEGSSGGIAELVSHEHQARRIVFDG